MILIEVSVGVISAMFIELVDTFLYSIYDIVNYILYCSMEMFSIGAELATIDISDCLGPDLREQVIEVLVSDIVGEVLPSLFQS